ncbi:MAG TPA: TonB family protein, partial [Thermoanaerobaculia bacterium]|nr:TonB family protein [Thermoanaerobaculia bacterium]
NIIHIYDLGKIGRDYYIAMEYVEGKDLRSILNTARQKGLPLPQGLALLVTARLASALDYAHRKRDFDNRELGLVHRDVSPQNVLITFEGDIKLCDFGIAKAVTKVNQTQTGALKGKLQYMSPEQAWGRNVDARSDIFSLGAILFEMLTGERLFPGDNEMSILEAVRDGRTRSARSVLPTVPAEVDAIVLKAIAREPGERFANASEMQSRIEAALYGMKPTPSHTDLAAYMHRLVSAEPAPAPAFPELPPPPLPPADVAAPVIPVMPVMMDEPVLPIPEGTATAVEALAPVGEVRVEDGERKGRTLLYVAIVAAVILGILLYLVFGRGKGIGAAAPPPPAAAQSPGSAPPAAPGTPGGAVSTNPSAPNAPNAPNTKLDISGMVDQELAKHEGEIRKQLEDKKRQLEKELALSRAANKGSPAPGGAANLASGAAVNPAPVPRPAVEMPAETAKPTEPQRAEPVPAREEPPPAPAPPPKAVAPPAQEPRETAPAPSVRPGDLAMSGPGVVPPELVSFSKPEYPPVARRMGVEGTVVVSVLVDENGRVEDAKLTSPIPQNVGINEAAVKAARAAHYKPAVKDGVKVKMWTRLKIPFKL